MDPRRRKVIIHEFTPRRGYHPWRGQGMGEIIKGFGNYYDGHLWKKSYAQQQQKTARAIKHRRPHFVGNTYCYWDKNRQAWVCY